MNLSKFLEHYIKTEKPIIATERQITYDPPYVIIDFSVLKNLQIYKISPYVIINIDVEKIENIDPKIKKIMIYKNKKIKSIEGLPPSIDFLKIYRSPNLSIEGLGEIKELILVGDYDIPSKINSKWLYIINNGIKTIDLNNSRITYLHLYNNYNLFSVKIDKNENIKKVQCEGNHPQLEIKHKNDVIVKITPPDICSFSIYL